MGGGDGWAVAIDTSNNIYQTGECGNSTYGTYNLNTGGIAESAFLVKYDPCGNVLWATVGKLKDSLHSTAFGFSVAIDKLNNPIITGSFYDTVFFGSFKLGTSLVPFGDPGTTNFFVTKYDPYGNALWAKQSQSPSIASNATAYSVVTDASNNIYVTGIFTDTVIIGSYTLKTAFINSSDMFWVKLDPNGNVIWAKQSIAGSRNSWIVPNIITKDNFGNLFITGSYGDTVALGSITLTTPTLTQNAFFAKYDTAGNVVWVRQPQLKGYSYSNGWSVTTDPLGNAYFTGSFGDTVKFDTNTLISNGQMFLVKYDPIGNMLWANQANSNYSSTGMSNVSDTVGNIYISISGSSPGGPSFPVTTVYQNDTFSMNNPLEDPTLILKLDYSGKVLCGSFLPTGSDDQNGIASDPQGNYVYFGSDLQGMIILGADTLNACCGIPSPGEQTFVGRWQACDNKIITCDSVISSTPQKEPCGALFVPDAFSPNKDGQNDILYIRGTCTNMMDFVIYDRWGNKVFESENINNGWDGTYKGRPMNTGTYVYYLKATMQDGSSLNKHGNITLVR
jgi:gliding motility-associated-like protein